jgi:hypothetical protein
MNRPNPPPRSLHHQFQACSHEVSTMAMICNWAHPGIAGAQAGHEQRGGGS